MIKPFKGSRRRIRQLASYSARLGKLGFRGMPLWKRTVSGKLWVSAKGRMYYVTPWVHGSKLDGRLSHLRKLGRVLARLHTLSRRLNLPPAPRSLLKEIRRQHTSFGRNMRFVRSQDHSAGRWFRENGSRCRELGLQAMACLQKQKVKALLRGERKAPPLVHRDVTRPNVIVTGGKVSIIDWDSMERGSSYYDLVKTLTNTAGFHPGRMKAFLKGYEEIRPLKKTERRLVSALYRLPREAWYVCSRAKAGQPDASMLAILDATWEERLLAVRWLDYWAEG
ncbi:phosphotransferase [Paenibacillus sp. CC-CFT747]|nr:phosphotransferase [Paenibacillus sp. CC-CFT747]